MTKQARQDLEHHYSGYTPQIEGSVIMSDNSIRANADSVESPNELALHPIDKRVAQSKEIVKWFFLISVVLMLISVISTVNTSSPYSNALEDIISSTQLDSPDTSSVDINWAPAGFTLWSSDSNIAWEWSAKNDCDQYGCITAYFISRDGCPNGLYAAINWLDANGAAVSYDNATLPSLRPMQKAKLRFEDILDSGKTGQMAEINCR